jgi:phosphate transport system substrate-binding protein
VKLIRAGVTAGLLVAAVGLAACSSSGSKGSTNTPAPGGNASTGASSTAAAGGISCTGAGDLTSDGSTAQQNAVNAWIKAYSAACGKTVVYSGGGSGQGVTDFTAKKVNFAGSDSALDPTKGEVAAATKACGSQAIDLPMVTGPIAVAFKVKGVSTLTLTPSTIAKIFTGKITKWNDSEIAGENSGVTLPSEKITVFFRSDQSGTTQNFENYLHTAVPTDYTATPSKTWVGVGQGKNGSQGVQQALTSTEGGIGYVELSYTGGLTTAKVDSGAGGVALNATTAGKAVAAATVAPSGTGDLSLKLDYTTKAAGAYPILLVTYEIVCTKYSDPTVGAAVKSFLTYTSSAAGQNLLTSVGSAPLPASVLTQVQAEVAKIS